MVQKRRRGWMFWCLVVAGGYNLVWGAWVVLFPDAFFDWLRLPRMNYPQVWQCVGMIVGVYGIGYWCAARDPVRHWPIVLVGLLGKILGPVGFLQAALTGALPWRFGMVNVTNDLIWWVPFGFILWRAWQRRNENQMTDSAADAPRRQNSASSVES
jgi:small multidrug resistance pump